MQVEFIGCTGAGKTTLITAVQERLAQIGLATSAFHAIAAPLGLQGVTNPTLRNLIQEGVGLPFFARTLGEHRRFVAFTVQMLARHGNFNLRTVNYLRSLERTLGAYELLKRSSPDQIVLVDEGTIVPAHNVFVYSAAPYSTTEIARYADLAPLADLLIYVKAPVETLLERTLQRADPPRELKGQNRASIENQLNRAVSVFEQLAVADRIRSRLLVAENSTASDQSRDRIVEQIIQFILKRQPAGIKSEPVSTLVL